MVIFPSDRNVKNIKYFVILITFSLESIVATGAMLRSFCQPALPARGISIRILQSLDGAGTPPKPP